jgi:hypothetical protein
LAPDAREGYQPSPDVDAEVRGMDGVAAQAGRGVLFLVHVRAGSTAADRARATGVGCERGLAAVTGCSLSQNDLYRHTKI